MNETIAVTLVVAGTLLLLVAIAIGGAVAGRRASAAGEAERLREERECERVRREADDRIERIRVEARERERQERAEEARIRAEADARDATRRHEAAAVLNTIAGSDLLRIDGLSWNPNGGFSFGTVRKQDKEHWAYLTAGLQVKKNVRAASTTCSSGGSDVRCAKSGNHETREIRVVDGAELRPDKGQQV